MNDQDPTASADIAVVVLAAGWSSRMGALKPLLPFGDSTVLGHVVATIAASGVGPAVVVVGNEGERVGAAAEACGARAVVNAEFAGGMLTSIQAGIAALPASVIGALILPVDVPLIRSNTLAMIAGAARTDPEAVHLPVFDGRCGHPPFIPRRLFAEILAAPREASLRDILKRHEDDTKRVPVIDSGILRDMDYPDEYRRLLAALSHRRHPDEAECEAMFDLNGLPEPTRRHSRAVTRLAVDLAARLATAGVPLDIDLVRAGALLHDITKGEPAHASAGARRVAAFGFAETAAVVAAHMEVAFVEGDALQERHVVYLADKLIKGEQPVSLDERFAPALGAFAGDPEALASARRRHAAAVAVLETIEARIGPVRAVPVALAES